MLPLSHTEPEWGPNVPKMTKNTLKYMLTRTSHPYFKPSFRGFLDVLDTVLTPDQVLLVPRRKKKKVRTSENDYLSRYSTLFEKKLTKSPKLT